MASPTILWLTLMLQARQRKQAVIPFSNLRVSSEQLLAWQKLVMELKLKRGKSKQGRIVHVPTEGIAVSEGNKCRSLSFTRIMQTNRNDHPSDENRFHC
jgi:hypothetical protein